MAIGLHEVYYILLRASVSSSVGPTIVFCYSSSGRSLPDVVPNDAVRRDARTRSSVSRRCKMYACR